MIDPGCLSDADLRALLLGELPDRLAEVAVAHLQGCPRCEAAARRLDPLADSLLRGLRQAVQPGPNTISLMPSDTPETIPDVPRPSEDQGASRPPGADVPGYTVVQEVGRGGMSVVYQAWQTRPRRLVALKMILNPTHATVERRVRLLAEADAIAALQHPHIVAIYEVGEHNGLPYLALEFMAGGSLAQQLGGVPRPPREAAALVEKLADAVHYAHEHGIVHRDLKPGNVLLTADGTPKVADFGLAKQQGPDLTATGAILGSPSYMAPEQAAGARRSIGPAADVYALGAILYELLTGRPPFRAATVLETLEQVRSQEPLAPSQLQAGTPRDLNTVCLKCLEKEPARRYAGAAALAEDLRRFREGRPIQARRTSGLERARRWCRRNPTVASLSAGLVAMGLLVSAGSVATAVRLGRAAQQAQQAEREAQEQLYDSLFVQAHANRTSQRPGQRLDSLKALAQAAQLGRALGRSPEEFLKLRNEAIACLALPDARLERDWEGSPPGTSGVALDARGERYAWSGADEGIHIRRVADHAELLRLPTLPAEVPSRLLRLRFSPDGGFLALWYDQWARLHPLQVWELKPGVSRPLLALADATGEAEFAPDGRSVAVGMPDGSVRFFDLADGRETRCLNPGLAPSRVAFHPDGHKLAVASTQQPRVQVHDLASGRLLYSLAHPKGVQAVAWDPEGRLLATGCNDRRIYLWDGASGAQRGILEGHGWEIRDLAFNDSGDWLASLGWDMTLHLWDVAKRRQLWQIEDIRVLGFHRGEHFMASSLAGRRVQLWACLSSAAFHVLHHPQSALMTRNFSPDSRWLATLTRDGTTWLWDVARQEQFAHLVDTPWANWDPAGRLLLATKDDQLVRRSVHCLREGNREKPGLGPPEILLTRADGFETGCPHCWYEGNELLVGVLRREPGARIQVFALGGARKKRWERHVANLVYWSISPDGRWMALGTEFGGPGVLILDAHTGELHCTLPVGDAAVAFSPDGRWLVTTTGRFPTPSGECSLWRTGTWEKVRSTPLRRISTAPGGTAISPDSTLLAVASAMNEIRLMRLETLEEIATLTAPEAGIILGVSISADGRYLVDEVTDTVHVWDLPRLRRGLREIGLDWEPAVAPDS
jgi:WD40 repeat protein